MSTLPSTARVPAIGLPPLHDPDERSFATWVGEWELRVLPWNDERHRYLASKGLLHVQLWHPRRRLSLLSASGMTGGRLELWTGEERLRLCCAPHAARRIATMGLRPVCPHLFAHLVARYVGAPSLMGGGVG